MLTKLSRFFERHLQPAGGVLLPPSTHQKQLATAALLIEVAMADHQLSDSELTSLSKSLARRFSLTDEEIDALTENARTESHNATSLHQFTQLINQYSDSQEKFALIKAMWEMAYADNELNKYEDYTIRKVADLIYVSHTDFMRAKSMVKTELGL